MIKKLGLNGKVALAVMGAVVVGTLFFSLINVGLDFSKIDWADWAGKMGINVALSLVTMFAGETAYISYVTTKENGKYQHSLGLYNEARNAVGSRTVYLGQYLQREHEKARKSAMLNHLLDAGIENAKAAMLLDLSDLPKLEMPYSKEIDGVVRNFKSFTKKQIEALRDVLEGKVNVKRMPKAFYLDKDSSSSGRSDYEEAGHIVFERRAAVNAGRGIKVASMIAISIMFASLTANDFMKGDDLQAWMNLISRIMACFGGFWAGCRNSSKANDIDCRALTIKTTLLTEYRVYLEEHPNAFTLTDEEWEAEAEVREYEKSKPAEAGEGEKEDAGEREEEAD